MQNDNYNKNVLTHETDAVDFNEYYEKRKKEIIDAGDLKEGTVEEQLNLLQQLSEFELGRFLLMNRGCDGYWTSYINLYPKRANKQLVTHPLEKLLLEKGVLASQQRFDLCQRIIQKSMKSGMKLCSIPCGLMDDLLTLDFSNVSDFKLIGIDIDKRSTDLAKQKAVELKLDDKCEFYVEDAWKLTYENEFDIITSNGLNFYVDDVEMLIKLYEIFYRAIKPGGFLAISTMRLGLKESMYNEFSPDEAKTLNLAFNKVINARWKCCCMEIDTINQLKQVGFKHIESYPTEVGIIPTLVARK